MFTSIMGVSILVGVMIVAFSERDISKLGYFDLHALIVVLGGVIGSLLVAIDRAAIWRMMRSLWELVPKTKTLHDDIQKTREGLDEMASAWQGGRRSEILSMADNGHTEELRVAADVLLQQIGGAVCEQRFVVLRTNYSHQMVPIIEAWDLVGKLAPSFGMVGTVTGMVQMFKNMGVNGGNMGGAIAMALLATLYGISIGAAVGGPMAARLNRQFNERMALLELVEKTVIALITESSADNNKGLSK